MAGLVGPPGEEKVDWTGCREYPDGRACHQHVGDGHDDKAHDDDDDDDEDDDNDDDCDLW